MFSYIGASLQPLLGAVSRIPGVRLPPKPICPPRPFAPRPDSTREELDAQLSRLDKNKAAWVAQSPAQRAQLLTAVLGNLEKIAPRLACDIAMSQGSYGEGIGAEM
jgi:hypothetical protein